MLRIDLQSGRPIYKQIVDYFKTDILNQTLKAHEQLPSIRALATTLRINPNTIKKAYLLLEQEGYIYQVQGKGSFVLPLKDEQLNLQKKEMQDLLQHGIDKAKNLGIPVDELHVIIDNLYKE